MDERRGGGPDGGEHARAAATARRVVLLRRNARKIAALQAEQLRLVAELDSACTAEAREQLCGTESAWGTPSELDLVVSLVTTELMTVLGIGEAAAQRLQMLATRLVGVLPATLEALESGQVDLRRATVLAEATTALDDDSARAVERLLLSEGGPSPWEGPSPRSWRAKVDRAVVKVDPDAALRRRTAAIKARAVRSWPNGDGTGTLQLTAADADIVLADRVLTDLALARPAVDGAGLPLTMDQRRSDAAMDLFRRVAAGGDLPGASGSRPRDIGVVLHADTLFGNGRASDDPGELRGLGAPAPLDPVTAATLASAQIADGAGTRVLLVDGEGVLQRELRFRKAPAGGWARESLSAAVLARLPDMPPLGTDAYEPSAAIEDHVRTRNPRCTAYDCARASHRCDLDHDTPWPRGPTDVDNLAPRCRRHHELKTRRMLRTRLHRDGSVMTTTMAGRTVTTRPEPLPGYGCGEAYAS